MAVIRAERFAVQALRRIEPGLVGKPVGLVEGEAGVAALCEISPELEACGVAIGMDAPLAMARCPALAVRPRNAPAEAEAQALLVAAAFGLSPRVEDTGPGVCTVDLQGADPERTRAAAARIAQELAALGLRVTIGLARTPLLASYAAAVAGGESGGGVPAASTRCREAPPVPASIPGLSIAGSLREVDDEPAFLAPLPLVAAAPSPSLAGILLRWGIHTLGAITAIGKAEFGRRLGAEGVALWERASGEATRPIVPCRLPRRFEAHWEFAEPVETLEPLLFILRRLLDRMELELKAAGFAAAALRLALELEDEGRHERELPLPEATSDPERWLRVLITHLEQVRTDAAIAGLTLAIEPARPLVKQPGLFDTGLKDPAAFYDTLARLAALVGADNVGAPQPANSHRPDSCALGRPEDTIPPAPEPPVHPPKGLVLRRFRPPLPAIVEVRGEAPCALASEATGASRQIVGRRGPWRESGDWWRETRWGREVWQVELAEGGVYQLTRIGSDWSVEGMLD